MEISNFNKDNIIKEIDKGKEGIVYLYRDKGINVALKQFFNNNEECNSNDNKELKLLILKNESVLKDDIKLLNRMYSMGKFIGFTSIYEPYAPLSHLDSIHNKLVILKEIRDRYLELNSHNIYIGDFNVKNFCFSQGKIKLFDIDNFRIDDLDFNVETPAMTRYMKKCKNIENIDYFCFNWFAFSFMSKVEQDMLLNRNYNAVPRKLKTREIIDFFEDLRHVDDNYTIEKTKDGKPKTLLNLLK